MRLRKILGSLLLFSGTLGALAGVLGALLPMLDNDQVRLILSSFETPSREPLVNGFNQLFLFILRYPYPVLGGGAVLALLGVALSWSRQEPEQRSQPQRPVAAASASGPYTVLSDSSSVQSTADWRRPATRSILPPSGGEYSADGQDAAPASRFAPPRGVATQGYQRETQAAESASVPNPYRSYGQSAYAPPARPSREEKPAPAPLEESAYRRPAQAQKAPTADASAAYQQPDSYEPDDDPFAPETAYLTAKAAFEPDPPAAPAQAYASRSAQDASPAPSRVFRKPSLTVKREDPPPAEETEKAHPIPALEPLKPQQAEKPVRIRSTIQKPKAALPVAEKNPLEPAAVEELPDAASPDEGVKMEYLSKRIRSTMGKKQG